MGQLLIRFIVGGAMVSLFAALGDVLKPKSFAGLFGAAPSVALATLSLTILSNGKEYAAVEARSMIIGALSFCLYAIVCCHILMKKNLSATTVTVTALTVWIVCALGLWEVALR